jgi:hypothetical protein
VAGEEVRVMELMTEELRRRLPKLREIEHEVDPLAVCRFLLPWTGWAWYVCAFDGADTCFGFVEGFDLELGFFTLTELYGISGPEGVTVMRDEWFGPKRYSAIKKAWKEFHSLNALMGIPR